MSTTKHSTSIFILCFLVICHESNQETIEKKVESINIIENNLLIQTSNPNIILESKTRTFVHPTDSTTTPQSNIWDDTNINGKTIEQKLNEKSKMKTNYNLYDSTIKYDYNENKLNDNSTISNDTNSADCKVDKSALFKQIAALSQMKNRFKHEPKSKNTDSKTDLVESNDKTVKNEESSNFEKDKLKIPSIKNKLKTYEDELLKKSNAQQNGGKDDDILSMKNLKTVYEDLSKEFNVTYKKEEIDNEDSIREELKSKRSIQIDDKTIDSTTKPISHENTFGEIFEVSQKSFEPIRIVKRSMKDNTIEHKPKRKMKHKHKANKHHHGHKRKGGKGHYEKKHKQNHQYEHPKEKQKHVYEHPKEKPEPKYEHPIRTLKEKFFHRKRRSISTEHVNKKAKEYDFITSLKTDKAQPPPIVTVLPIDKNIYYRNGRADQKLFSQNYERDVQELIRHNLQYQSYVSPNNLQVNPNGNNDYLNSMDNNNNNNYGRNGNQRRIVYYATLPEIVRRPASLTPVPESLHWSNYMVPREYSGSTNNENEEFKVQSTMIDVKPNQETNYVPVQTIQQPINDPNNNYQQQYQRSDNINMNNGQSGGINENIIQTVPYYNGNYPIRHERFPYYLSNSILPIQQQKSLVYNSPISITPTPTQRSYELNGKRYGIYQIPTLQKNKINNNYIDNNNILKPYNDNDDIPYINNFDNYLENYDKFNNYAKFYNQQPNFDNKPLIDNNLVLDLNNNNNNDDFDLGAYNTKTKSYSLQILPKSSVTYSPSNSQQQQPNTSSNQRVEEYNYSRKDIVGKHTTNTIQTVDIGNNNNNTVTHPNVHNSTLLGTE